MKFIFLIALIFIAVPSIADSFWSVELRLDQVEGYVITDGIVLPDGETVISLAGAFVDPFLVCFDDEGEILWYRNILEKGGSSRSFESCGRLAVTESGFAVCYNSEPRATGINTDIAVVLLSPSGEIIWTYILGEDDDSNWACTDILSCSDGGLLITGCPGMMLPEGFVFKLASDGELEWMTAPGEISGYAFSAVELPEGDFIILVEECVGTVVFQRIRGDGIVFPPVTVSEDMDSFGGNIHLQSGSVWFTDFTEDSLFHALSINCDLEISSLIDLQIKSELDINSVILTEDGLLIAGSLWTSAGLSMYDFYGENVWSRTLETGRDEYFEKVYIGNGTILALGRMSSDFSERYSGWIVRSDSATWVEDAMLTYSGKLLIDPIRIDLPFDSPGWVIACSVVEEENTAETLSNELASSTGLQSGYLWIPDWQTLSGADGWLVYALPYLEGPGTLDESVEVLREMYPDAYCVYVSSGWERRTMTIDELLD
ncbi:MAG: hypothetical protein JXR55_10070 [Candidatus Fermentibacteraceae bacterium]|nr:hypothetical protein [Candidatus Fermentibacteraceae bacterium]